ncbi:unnamed protein product [Lactuca saligna]|uniref:Uncharacterized protein n=1 Tax=Lactuca saligna TaxID=75948 RepID=A0AA36EL32_LACSI|nr:unnamed protein product [Lactuca saligna]
MAFRRLEVLDPSRVRWSYARTLCALVDPSMAATFPTPPAKKPATSFPPRRGRVKAQIFEGVAEAVASAASRAGDFLGLIKKDDTPVNEGSKPAPPPETTKTYGEDGKAA